MSISTRLYGIPSRASARRTLELFPDRCSEESVYIQNKIRMREAYPRAGSSRSRSNRNVYRAAPPKRYSNDRTDKVWQLQGHTRIHKNIKCVRCSAASEMQISRAAVNGNFILGHFLANSKDYDRYCHVYGAKPHIVCSYGVEASPPSGSVCAGRASLPVRVTRPGLIDRRDRWD